LAEKKGIQEGQIRISHQFVADNALLLTAPTAQLQALVSRYGDDPKAFPDPEEYRRAQ
jgi:hypothetical protein